MLFPENPENRPALWDSVASQLAQEQVCIVIESGAAHLDSKAALLDHDMASSLVNRLRKSPVCRISASRGKAISPHFAGRLEGANFYLTELITLPMTNSATLDINQLRNDLETTAINILYSCDGAARVFIPLSIDPWLTKDMEVRPNENGLVFERK